MSAFAVRRVCAVLNGLENLQLDQLLKSRKRKRKFSKLKEEGKMNEEEKKFHEVKRQDWKKLNSEKTHHTRTDEYMNRLLIFDKMKPKSFYVSAE